MKNHLSKITILFAAIISVLLVGCNQSNSYYRIGLSSDDPPSYDVLLLKGDTVDVYGPFSFDDYLKMKAELGVPDILKLKYEKR